MIEKSRSIPMLTPTQGTLLHLGSNIPTRPSHRPHCQQAPPRRHQAQPRRSPQCSSQGPAPDSDQNSHYHCNRRDYSSGEGAPCLQAQLLLLHSPQACSQAASPQVLGLQTSEPTLQFYRQPLPRAPSRPPSPFAPPPKVPCPVCQQHCICS